MTKSIRGDDFFNGFKIIMEIYHLKSNIQMVDKLQAKKARIFSCLFVTRKNFGQSRQSAFFNSVGIIILDNRNLRN